MNDCHSNAKGWIEVTIKELAPDKVLKISVDAMLHNMIEEELQQRGEMNAILL